MGKDEALLDSSASAFLRLGDNDDLTVFEQELGDAAMGIADKGGGLRVTDEAERRVRKVAEGASTDADDRLKVLLECVERFRREVEADGG